MENNENDNQQNEENNNNNGNVRKRDEWEICVETSHGIVIKKAKVQASISEQIEEVKSYFKNLFDESVPVEARTEYAFRFHRVAGRRPSFLDDSEKDIFKQKIVPAILSSPFEFFSLNIFSLRNQLLHCLQRCAGRDINSLCEQICNQMYQDIRPSSLNDPQESYKLHGYLACLLVIGRRIQYRHFLNWNQRYLNFLTNLTLYMEHYFNVTQQIKNPLSSESLFVGEMLRLLMNIFNIYGRAPWNQGAEANVEGVWYYAAEMLLKLKVPLEVDMNADSAAHKLKYMQENMTDFEAPKRLFKDPKEYMHRIWWKAKIQAMIYIDRGAKKPGEFWAPKVSGCVHLALDTLYENQHRFVPSKLLLTAMRLLEDVVDVVSNNEIDSIIRDNAMKLTFEVVFPRVCLKQAEIELWDTDPKRLLNTVLDYHGDMGISEGMANFLTSLIRRERHTLLSPLFDHLHMELKRPFSAETEPQQYGALTLVSTIIPEIRMNKYKDMLLELLKDVIVHLDSKSRYLRARAAHAFGQFGLPLNSLGPLVKSEYENGIPKFLLLLGDSDTVVRSKAIDSLQIVVPKISDLTVLVRLLQDHLDVFFESIEKSRSTRSVSTMITIITCLKQRISPFAAEICSRLV